MSGYESGAFSPTGNKSLYHSLTTILAKKRRKLLITPGFVNYPRSAYDLLRWNLAAVAMRLAHAVVLRLALGSSSARNAARRGGLLYL